MRKIFSSVKFPIIVAPLILLLPIILTGKVLFWGTPSLQFIPWRAYVLEQLLSGVFPLWNPLNGMGAPLLANYQIALFYPPTWFLLIVGWITDVAWMAWAHTIIALCHIIWAGIGMAALMKRFGFSKSSQSASGISFALCGYFVARLGFFSMIWAGSWLPWLLLTASVIAFPGNNQVQKPTKSVLFPLVFCITMQFLAGHAQLTWYSLLLVFFWILVGGWKQGKVKQAIFVVFNYIKAVFFAILLASIQLIPTAEYLIESHRSSAVDYEMAMTYSFWPWRFLGLLAPNLYGNPGSGDYWGYASFWEDAVYIGVLPLILALITLPLIWSKKDSDNRNRSIVRFLWSLVFISIILSLGKNTPIFPFLYRYIPTFEMFNAPTRYMIWFEISMVILAGIGFMYWKKPTGKGLYWLRLGTAGGFAVTLGAFLTSNFLQSVKSTIIQATAISGLWLLGVGILTLTIPADHNSAKRKIWNIAVLLWVGLDLIVAGSKLNPSIDRDFYEPGSVSHEELIEDLNGHRLYISKSDEYQLKFERFLRFEDFTPKENWTNFRYVLIPNFNLLEGISSANNFDPLLPGRYVEWMNYIEVIGESQRDPWFQMMDVQVVESENSRAIAGVDFTLSSEPGRLWWSQCAILTQNEDQSFEQLSAMMQLMDSEYDSSLVIIEDKNNEYNEHEMVCNEGGTQQIKLSIDMPTRVLVDVNSSSAGYLVLADIWYPGWGVWIDGEKRPLLRANYLFRGVEVPEGDHNVEFRYQPLSFIIGFVISAVSWLMILIWVFLKKRKTKNESSNIFDS
jgi:hypothetical protein